MNAPSGSGRSVLRVALVCAACALLVVLSACGGRDSVRTTTKDAIDATGTAQAEGFAGSARGIAAADGKTWPAKIAQFADGADYQVWYPRYLPPGFKVETIDAVEFDPGAGVVCDVMYLSGDSVIAFTQGSPKMRDYEIVSAESVDWGGEKGDVVHEDPADPASPAFIVFSAKGNLAELRGDVPLAELKKIAASMEPVK